MITSPEIDQISLALGHVQAAGLVAIARRKNAATNSSYANLNDVLQEILPELQQNNLVFIQPIGKINTQGAIHSAGLTTRIIHFMSGQWMEESGDFPLAPPPVSKQGYQILNHSQAHGLALTYARRYALLSFLGITTGDDKDAAALSRAMEQPDSEVKYEAPPHWTDYTGGAWKDVPSSKGRPLGDFNNVEMTAERKAYFETSPALQASLADAISAIFEQLGATYEDIQKPAGTVWPEWHDMMPSHLRTLFNWVITKKPKEDAHA